MPCSRSSRCSLLVLALTVMSLASVHCEDRKTIAPAFTSIPLPSGLLPEKADLTIRGKLGRGDVVSLDLKTIMSFPSVTFRSIDPWDGKEHSFTGVSLRDLLAWANVNDESASLLFTAKNKYSIPVKRSDYEAGGYVLAWMMDGKTFTEDPATRKRGPLAIAIDFSTHKNLTMELYKHQLVWQLVDILAQ